MSKADKLREALKAANNRLPLAEAIKVAGSRGNISNMITTGEVEIETTDDGKFLTLDPNYAAKRKLPIKRPAKSKRAKGGKKKHAKAPRKARPFKAIADKLLKPSPDDVTAQFSLRDLAIDNLIASALNLAETLRREVEGVENNPNLIAAIDQQERAAQIARAA